MIEQPMQNPHLWKASISAIRAFESTLIALQKCKIAYEFISVHKWRKMFLPGYTKTMSAAEAKTIGLQIGIRMFPELKDRFEAHGDPDGLLIAEYCKRIHLGTTSANIENVTTGSNAHDTI